MDSSLVHALIKGRWTDDEDKKLIRLVKKHGVRKWAQIAEKVIGRAGEQCRKRSATIGLLANFIQFYKDVRLSGVGSFTRECLLPIRTVLVLLSVTSRKGISLNEPEANIFARKYKSKPIFSTESILTFVSKTKEPSNWLFVSKLIQPKHVAREGEQQNGNEVDKIDAALGALKCQSNTKQVQNLLKPLEALGSSIQDIDEELDSVLSFVKSVLSYVSAKKAISKQRSSSLVSKFMQPKREGIDSEAVQNLLKALQT
ncbi:hypothetical protein RJ640_020747 [Escallonia rubra]|uniref:MYB transcription factor n=1 Tax=Escallonia rubra TaxID=112253 RepID=A0AA88RT48_9ASTE|nr:hypothetical protein RJ640_020747 [Escallonia rubra]